MLSPVVIVTSRISTEINGKYEKRKKITEKNDKDHKSKQEFILRLRYFECDTQSFSEFAADFNNKSVILLIT
ncbi:unnamed protein product [Rhizophagus irregularis]|nr:unnamed protein product [Rhizophagus irregularis]